MFFTGKCWWTSSRRVANKRAYDEFTMKIPFDLSKCKILLIDDTSFSVDGQLNRVKNRILEKYPHCTVYKTAIYAMINTARYLDFYCKIISNNHWVAKDLLIRRQSDPLGFDMDGVLCYNPSIEITIDDTKYLEFIRTVQPLYIPLYKIDYIITGRLEKYRYDTELWLTKHKVNYGKLIMQKGTDKRIGTDHAVVKANAIREIMPNGIYVESSFEQAKKIYDSTGVPVLVIETMQLVGAKETGYTYHSAFDGYRKSYKHPLEIDSIGKPTHKPNWLFP